MAEQTAYVGTLFDEVNNPNKVTVAYTMGVKALEAGHAATIMLMVDAVHLAKPGKVDKLDIGAPFMPVKDLQEVFLKNGGKVVVCKACMIHNGVNDDEIDERFQIIGAEEVVPLLMNAQGTLQLT